MSLLMIVFDDFHRPADSRRVVDKLQGGPADAGAVQAVGGFPLVGQFKPQTFKEQADREEGRSIISLPSEVRLDEGLTSSRSTGTEIITRPCGFRRPRIARPELKRAVSGMCIRTAESRTVSNFVSCISGILPGSDP